MAKLVKRYDKILLALSISLFVLGCESESSVLSRTHVTALETAVLVRDQCVIRTPPEEAVPLAGLAVAVAPQVIDLIFKVGTHFLESTPEDFEAIDYAATARNGFFLSESNSQAYELRFNCLIFVRGRFSPNPGDTKSPLSEDITKDWTAQNLNSLGLVERPEFYIESALILAYAGKEMRPVLRIEPIFFDYQGTKAKRRGNGVKNVNMIVKLLSPNMMRGDNTQPAQIVFGEANISLGPRKIGADPVSGPADFEHRKIATSTWIPLPNPVPEEIPPEDGVPFFPFSVEVSVEEAGERSQLREKVETGSVSIINALQQPITDMVTKILKDQAESN